MKQNRTGIILLILVLMSIIDTTAQKQQKLVKPVKATEHPRHDGTENSALEEKKVKDMVTPSWDLFSTHSEAALRQRAIKMFSSPRVTAKYSETPGFG